MIEIKLPSETSLYGIAMLYAHIVKEDRPSRSPLIL